MKTNQIPAKRSNYTRADRPEQVPVTHIVIHSTELSYPETVQRFQEAHDVSAHYVLWQSDGLVTQMVAPHNVAWHAGNWELNCRAVGIEQEAYVGEPESFTKTMLRSLTTLVSQLSTQFNVPLDRDHLLGHDNLCAMTASGQLSMHQDPGRYFDWRQLLTDLGASVEGRGVPVVGEPVVVCVTVADLYQSPERGAKLLTDETLPGWTHQVSYGQRFVCADKKGDWVAIWYSGKLAWCHNPEYDVLQACEGDVFTLGAPTAIYGTTAPDADSIARLNTAEQYVAGPTLHQLVSVDDNGQLRATLNTKTYYQFFYNHRIAFVPIDTVHFEKKV